MKEDRKKNRFFSHASVFLSTPVIIFFPLLKSVSCSSSYCAFLSLFFFSPSFLFSLLSLSITSRDLSCKCLPAGAFHSLEGGQLFSQCGKPCMWALCPYPSWVQRLGFLTNPSSLPSTSWRHHPSAVGTCWSSSQESVMCMISFLPHIIFHSWEITLTPLRITNLIWDTSTNSQALISDCFYSC